MWELVGFGFNGQGQIDEETKGGDVKIPVVVREAEEEMKMVFVGWSELLCEYSPRAQDTKS